MNRKKLLIAESAIKQIAVRKGKTVEEIRKEIQKAMLIGLCSQDPKVQAYWRRIPCKGDVCTYAGRSDCFSGKGGEKAMMTRRRNSKQLSYWDYLIDKMFRCILY